MNVPMKMKVIHMKKSNIHMNEGVLGDFPLTRSIVIHNAFLAMDIGSLPGPSMDLRNSLKTIKGGY